MSNATNSDGIGIGFLLFIIFLILKLTHTINWSWWWVTAPLWIPVAFIMIIFLLTFLYHLKRRGNRRSEKQKAQQFNKRFTQN